MSVLRLLLIEDSEDDALLLERELERGGYKTDLRRVDGERALEEALSDGDWDMVITDHNLPGFSSEQAMNMVKEVDIDIPVIIVSGSIGEDVAVAAMKTGAQDYIMKGNLHRLVPAIERELREAENRKVSRRAQETIHHMAYHDALTGLSNRHEFENRVKHALHTAEVDNNTHVLIYLDLDQFKIINDTCGHQAGDELLRQLSVLLKDAVREGDCLSRLGGDEFGILLENCTIKRAEFIANKILQMINDFHFIWENKAFTVGASMGVVAIDSHNKSISEVLKNADIACYVAKDRGRNRFHLYRADDNELALRHGEMEWVARIQTALHDDLFVLHKQCISPILKSQVDRTYCEFLIRLPGKNDELILPGAFLPAAERYNLMPAIDRWVIKTVFAFLARKFGNQSGKENKNQYFINLSGASLSDEDFFSYIKKQFTVFDIDPGMICFEITETVAITNLQETVGFIKEIRAIGCKIALDDFGAGLSSFSYLKAIPADYLKIDGNFVRDITHDKMDRAIVESINQIAKVAGLQTIAEFVEDEAILEVIKDIGVDFAQGYGIQVPVPIEED
ncbi:MAG: EAL domain-containing protein [Gammaproteobacteria bacterium]|nr:EAL domain-containing protein [Gammaproteobacteria bacterium]